MTFEEVYSVVAGVPFITEPNARKLYQLIREKNIKNILELGIAHGTATCIMAAAIEENGGGKITSVDIMEMKEHFKPSPEEQLEGLGLNQLVEIKRMKTGYTWFLHDEIKKQTKDDRCEPIYDLCIIDGPKNWTIDGAAFFMADKLLKNNGFIIFDDYHWTYAQANRKREATDGISHRSLSKNEFETPHIQEVFELLVKQHPSYGGFTLYSDSDWAIAEKNNWSIKSYEIRYSETTKDVLAKFMRKIHRKIR